MSFRQTSAYFKYYCYYFAASALLGVVPSALLGVVPASKSYYFRYENSYYRYFVREGGDASCDEVGYVWGGGEGGGDIDLQRNAGQCASVQFLI